MTDTPDLETTPARCRAQVEKRDTYRVNRGSPSGFKMHYNRCQCSRPATRGMFCTQHAKVTDGRFVAEYANAR